MFLDLFVFIAVATFCSLCRVSITEGTTNCVPETDFAQNRCRCNKYTGYILVRNHSMINSTVLLACPIPPVCVTSRFNAWWSLSRFDAGSLVGETGPSGPHLLHAINGTTIGPRNGVTLDVNTGFVSVRVDIPDLLSKILCSVTVVVFPPTPESKTSTAAVKNTTETTENRMTTMLTNVASTAETTTESIWTTINSIIMATQTPLSTIENEAGDALMISVPFRTFVDPATVTVPLISDDDQTPLFIILGLLVLCLALSLLLAVLYARGAFGHRGGQWETLTNHVGLRLPRMPRPLREHGLPETAPALL